MHGERLGTPELPYEPEVAELLASMMPPGIEPLRLFRTLAHNPRILGKIRNGNLLDRGSLERVDRELVILRTTGRCRSEYEWGVHVSVFARRYGIPADKIEGTLLWDANDARWSRKETALLRLVDELHDGADVGDELWGELSQLFASEQIVELLVLVGFYHTISFVTNGLRIAHEENADRFPSA